MRKVAYSVAAIGSSNVVSTFSGIPYHFYHALQQSGVDALPWEMDLEAVNTYRKWWNAMQLLSFRKPGGFQYSATFRREMIRQIPATLLSTNVIAFNQHFPPAELIRKNNGKVYYYIDATFSQLLDRYGVASKIGKDIRQKTLARERESFHQAEMIFTFQQWAKDSVVGEYGIPEHKVKVILPGANIVLEENYRPPVKEDSLRAGIDRPLVLGFVGKDWKRKGLMVLVQVRDLLEKKGYKVVIRCAGYAPADFSSRHGIEFAGFIDKQNQATRFISFLESCDIGCLFSEAEFSSISVLEFLRAGIPVSGYVVDGMGDLFFADASIRFTVDQDVERIAEGFIEYMENSELRNSLQRNAREKSAYVTWQRCVEQMKVYLNG